MARNNRRKTSAKSRVRAANNARNAYRRRYAADGEDEGEDDGTDEEDEREARRWAAACAHHRAYLRRRAADEAEDDVDIDDDEDEAEKEARRRRARRLYLARKRRAQSEEDDSDDDEQDADDAEDKAKEARRRAARARRIAYLRCKAAEETEDPDDSDDEQDSDGAEDEAKDARRKAHRRAMRRRKAALEADWDIDTWPTGDGDACGMLDDYEIDFQFDEYGRAYGTMSVYDPDGNIVSNVPIADKSIEDAQALGESIVRGDQYKTSSRCSKRRRADSDGCDEGGKKPVVPTDEDGEDSKESKRAKAKRRARLRRKADGDSVSDDLSEPEKDDIEGDPSKEVSDDLSNEGEADDQVQQTEAELPDSVNEAEDKVVAAFRLIDAQVAHKVISPNVNRSRTASRYCKTYTGRQMDLMASQLENVGKAGKTAGNVRVNKRSASVGGQARTASSSIDDSCLFA